MRRAYLVRHGKAGSRSDFEGADERRPLSAPGRRQADALAEELLERGAGGGRLLSSPARRCLETLAPLAERCGLEVKQVRWLEEGSDPLGAIERLSQVSEEVVVACTHGDVIWGILEWLARGGVELGPKPDAQKASAWVLDWPDGEAEGVPIRAGYLPPPAG